MYFNVLMFILCTQTTVMVELRIWALSIIQGLYCRLQLTVFTLKTKFIKLINFFK